MNQGGAELFYESYLEALKDDVKAIGGSKAVGQKFWPELQNVEIQRGRVNDRLNPDKRDRFTDDQERYIMREAVAVRGYSAAVCFICDEVNLERPKAKSREDEVARLQREFIDAVKNSQRLGERLERLATMPPLQAITGGRS